MWVGEGTGGTPALPRDPAPAASPTRSKNAHCLRLRSWAVLGPVVCGVQRDDAYLSQPALATVTRIKLYHESLFR